jgi:hypothetical protein
MFGKYNDCVDEAVIGFVIDGLAPSVSRCQARVLGEYLPVIPTDFSSVDSSSTVPDVIRRALAEHFRRGAAPGGQTRPPSIKEALARIDKTSSDLPSVFFQFSTFSSVYYLTSHFLFCYTPGCKESPRNKKGEVTVSEFIMVPVPEDRVQEVYTLLASPPGGDPPAASAVVRSSEWTQDEVIRAYRESHGHMKGVLDYLAARPGQPVRSDELYQALGLTSDQFKGVMGSWGKRSKNRYEKNQWFFDGTWNPESWMVVYTMSEEDAETIRNEG